MSLYLSEYLSKKKHGFEYGSLEIKNHLEKLSFSEIVSTSMIMLVTFNCLYESFWLRASLNKCLLSSWFIDSLQVLTRKYR